VRTAPGGAWSAARRAFAPAPFLLVALLLVALPAPRPARAGESDDGAPPATDASGAPDATPDTEAPTPDETPSAPIETVTVSAEAERAVADPTAFATVIRASDYADRITTLPDLLSEAVGVQVKSLGGEFATVSIRGSSAEQVVVYLDGVPLNRALGGGVNLADIPLVQLDSIEIYRGVTPASLSMASIGGAILLHSRAPGPGDHGGASASYGSYSTAQVAASYAHGGENGDGLVAVDGATSDGDFTYLDNNGTPAEPADDVTTRRVNNAFTRAHALLRGGLTEGPARITVLADLMGRDQGVPGIDALQSPTSRLSVRRSLLSAGAEAPGLAGGRLLLRGSLQGTLYSEAFDGSSGDIGWVPRSSDHRMESTGLETGGTWILTRRQALSFMGALRLESARLDDVTSEAPPSHSEGGRRIATATIEDQISWDAGRFVLNPSLRHERYDSRFTPGTAFISSPADDLTDASTTGKIGILARLTGALALRANAGSFLRLPDLQELYGYQGSIEGNPALLPERGTNFDLGLTATTTRAHGALREGRVEGVLFETRADNLIVYEAVAPSTVQARNTGEALIRGVELSGSFAAGRFNGTLSIVHQAAVDASDTAYNGNDLPGRPRDELNAGAGLAIGRGRAAWEFTYVGANYVDRPNTEDGRLPARYLHDLSYRLPLAHRIEATLAVHNLFDDRTVDVARFPLPGRSFEGRLAWSF
jgi:iron complex outermembrane receptor protein